MSEESTRKLEGVLKSVGNGVNADEFAEKNQSEYDFFYEFFNDYIAEHGLNITEIINRSRVSKNYVYNIVNGIKKNPGRDKIIALSIAAAMNVEMTNRALRISGARALYPKNKRDVYIAECINRGKTDIIDVNMVLSEKGEKILDI